MKFPFPQRDEQPMTDAEAAVRVAEIQEAGRNNRAELDAATRRECAKIAARAQIWAAVNASARWVVPPGAFILLHIL